MKVIFLLLCLVFVCASTDPGPPVYEKLRGAEENLASEDGYNIAIENHDSMQLFDQLRGKKKCETMSYCKDVGGECTKKKKCDGSIKNVKKGCSKGCVCCISAPNLCSDGVILHDQCLVFSQEVQTWANAKAACESRGQALASLSEPKAILDYIHKTYGDVVFIVGGSRPAAKEGDWKWLNGQSISTDPAWFPWAKGQPDNAHGTQPFLGVNFEGGYDDRDGRTLNRYICEKSYSSYE